MKQKLKEKNNILFLLDKEKTTENIIFSRLEQYSYYKGENRAELNKKLMIQIIKLMQKYL